MHFSIPDTTVSTDKTGSFTLFNVHVNGVFHCSVRYRQLHGFHEQLKKEFGGNILPGFPPKKILSLTELQLEERRCGLERYVQMVSQNPQISNSDTFNGFLLSAQQESQKECPESVTLDVYLINGHKISTNIMSTDQTDDVLETVASQIQLADDYVYYFGLYLVKKDDTGENSIVRKLQEFESPYISLNSANQTGTHRIVLRKTYWDSIYDDDLIEDRVAMNLIYVQALSDIERGWVVASNEQHQQLQGLHHRGSKKEYLRFARTLKYYGHLQLHPCLTDYPQAGCQAIISAGHRELCVQIQPEVPEGESGTGESGAAAAQLELAFEYLMARDTLQWITFFTDQAILLSMCLQGMVDELLQKKEGRRMKRDGHKGPGAQNKAGLMVNDSFDGIGDDDL